RDTWVTGSRIDVARPLRPVWNDPTRRGLLRHRQSCPSDRNHEPESKHKIHSRFHSYPDLLKTVLGSEETESPSLVPSLFNFQSGYVYHLAMNSFHFLAEIGSESRTPDRWESAPLRSPTPTNGTRGRVNPYRSDLKNRSQASREKSRNTMFFPPTMKNLGNL